MAKWIEFRQAPSTGKTEIWDVVAKEGGTPLGKIKWFGSWRQYAFFPEPYTVFEGTCMADITAKIRELSEQRKSQRAADNIMSHVS